MPVAVADRIPGVVVRDVEPRAEERPRLDVAGFVGFAERGPVNLPRAVDDVATFERHFGRADVELESGDAWLRPLLPQAVKAFFENGGRRCHVVRVCGEAARRAEWEVKQIIREDGRTMRVRASSPGRWANPYTITLRLQISALGTRGPVWQHTNPAVPDGTGYFALGAPDEWETGDVLRVVSEPVVPDEPGIERLYYIARIVPDRVNEGSWRTEGRFIAGPSAAEFDGQLRRLERLRFDLEVTGPTSERGATREHETLTDLAFGPGNDRYWLDVIARDSIYLAPPDPEPDELISGEAPKPVTFPRLAKGGSEPDQLEDAMRPKGIAPKAVPSDGVGSDDFGNFGVELFVPPELSVLGAAQLQDIINEAQEAAHAEREGHRASRRLYAREPMRLAGILALLPIDEIGLLAVPDALQIEGGEVPPDDLDVYAPPAPAPAPAGQPPVVCATAPGDLLDCVPKPPPPAPPPPAEAPPPLPLVSKPRRRIYGFTEEAAREIQQGAVRFCSQRGDVVAVLATPRRRPVPGPFPDVDEIEWRRALEDYVHDFSYAALYAPWTLVAAPTERDSRAIRAVPPDGVVCGAIAKRERARGVWVAPANEPLRGIIGLDQALDDARWADVLDAGVNLVRPIPGDFRIMSARTMALETEWTQLNVRRLMIYLKKLLLLWGRTYVFENNTPALRGTLKRRIERELERLYKAGAFAGETPAESYQVVVDDTVNTPASIDLGQLIVLVKVAPSWPMEFLEVRLVRIGEGPLQVLEG